MNRKTVLRIVVILNLLLTGCGESHSYVEEPITYISWLTGEWQIKDVMAWGGSPINEGWDMVKGYIGVSYNFTEPLGEVPSGGVVPIREMELQPFFHGEGYLKYLDLTGNYYTLFGIDIEEWEGSDTCFVVKNKEEWMVWKECVGIFRLQRIDDVKEQVRTYDANMSFEENIRRRMEEQGIRCDMYYNNVWAGNWTVEEVIYAEDIAEAQTHLGETVFFRDSGVDYFDIHFIGSSDDRIFYHMPTTGELGLQGAYYLLIWDEDQDYPAAIVASEHEMFLVQGNTLFRAVQEEEYLDDALLQGL